MDFQTGVPGVKSHAQLSSKAAESPKPDAGESEEIDITQNQDEREREMIGRADQVWNRSRRRHEFYKSKPSRKNRTRFMKYVILVRRIIDEVTGHCEETKVDIKGKRLRQALEQVHEETLGFGFDEGDPSIDPKLMFHSLAGLRQLEAKIGPKDPERSEILFELQAGIKFILEEFEAMFESLAALRQKGQITFNLLWTLFPPNTIVRGLDRLGHPRAYICRSAQEVRPRTGAPYFELSTDYLDSNGEAVGWVQHVDLTIASFDGLKQVLELDYWPVEMHFNATNVKNELLEAGKLALTRHGRQLVEYQGLAYTTTNGRNARFNPHGRIILDPATLDKVEPDNGIVPDIEVLREEPIEDRLLMLMNTVVYGFCLGDKIWGSFSIARCKTVAWEDSVFDSLVLDERRKQFVHDLVHEHRAQAKESFDDIIRDKGKGLVGLLSGPPGVGKTLTAEAIAEVTRRPLYTISSGELGYEPTSIHAKLTEILELAELWDAVILLDEADVFLAQRDNNNLSRNAIASVFLRELEYYQGIIILTTNRIASIDQAFQSRIHFSLQYANLDTEQRAAIWEVFLGRARGHTQMRVTIDDLGVRELATMSLNGRQIKNAMSVAQTVALRRKQPLTVDAIREALEVSQDLHPEF